MSRLSFRLLLAQAADATTFAAFYLLIGSALHAERNPLVLGLMAVGGVQAVVLFKLALAGVVGWRHDHRAGALSVGYVRARTVAMSVATASGIVGAAFNVAAILSSMAPGHGGLVHT